MSEDYPRTFLELERRFNREEACAEYLAALRWPGGWVCPRCAGAEAWPIRRNRWRCDQCRYENVGYGGDHFSGQSSAPDDLVQGHVAGHQPKERHQRSGLAAGFGLGQLQNRLGDAPQIASGHGGDRGGNDSREAWKRTKPTWAGWKEGVRGRQTESKALIVVAAEEDGKGIGRIRMQRIPDASARSLVCFVEESVEPGSVVHTDGWLGYEPLQARGYIHQVTFLRGQQKSPSELLPRVHRVISLLKRSIRVRSDTITWMIISTSSPFDSTVVRLPRAANCSIAWPSRLCR